MKLSENDKFIIRLAAILLALIGFAAPTDARNLSLWWELTDSMKIKSGQPLVSMRSLSNANQKILLSFFLYAGDSPIEINKVEFEKRDTTFEPLEDLQGIYSNKRDDGKDIYWTIDVEFPFDTYFDEKDYIVVHTNKGVLRTPASREGTLLEIIDNMKASETQLKEQLEEYRSAEDRDRSREALSWSLTVLLAVLLISSGIFFSRKFASNSKKIEKMSTSMDELKSETTKAKNLLGELYTARLCDLNKICDEYYEKKDAENMKLSMYNEIEKHILTYKDSSSLADLENNVNLFQNDILKRLREQLPELTKKDFVFLTYLFSGFSARAICIFTDINLKQFYYRRNKLRETILASEAPDKEEFVSKI